MPFTNRPGSGLNADPDATWRRLLATQLAGSGYGE
jgi:hypothetical protein